MSGTHVALYLIYGPCFSAWIILNLRYKMRKNTIYQIYIFIDIILLSIITQHLSCKLTYQNSVTSQTLC